MALLRQIRTLCEKQQYCHDCPIRSFCTELRAKPPKYWPEKVLQQFEPAEEPAPAKKTRKKKGE